MKQNRNILCKELPWSPRSLWSVCCPQHSSHATCPTEQPHGPFSPQYSYGAGKQEQCTQHSALLKQLLQTKQHSEKVACMCSLLRLNWSCLKTTGDGTNSKANHQGAALPLREYVSKVHGAATRERSKSTRATYYFYFDQMKACGSRVGVRRLVEQYGCRPWVSSLPTFLLLELLCLPASQHRQHFE